MRTNKKIESTIKTNEKEKKEDIAEQQREQKKVKKTDKIK